MASKSSEVNENLQIVSHSRDIIDVCPIITRDTKYVITACQSDVMIYHRQTGVREQTFKKHKDKVIDIYLDVNDPLQVVSCSKTTLYRWDYSDLTVSKTKNFTGGISHLLLNPKDSDIIYYIKRSRDEGKKKKKRWIFYRNSFSKLDSETELGSICKLSKSCCISSNGKYVTYFYKNKLYVYSEKTNTKTKFIYNEIFFTCLTFHPKKNVIATGDRSGKILVWYNLINEKDVIQKVLHWHPTSVNDLLFTEDECFPNKDTLHLLSHGLLRVVVKECLLDLETDFGCSNSGDTCKDPSVAVSDKPHQNSQRMLQTFGDYLLSGASEGVLVIWQLESGKTSFVPRLGGSIKHLFTSQDGQYVGISLASNIIKLLSVLDYKLSSTVKILSKGSTVNAGLAYHKKLGCVCLNGYPNGIIQFYHPVQDSVKLSLDIIGENYIPSIPERAVYPTSIERIAFSECGTWMSTVEMRHDRILPVERKLKIWEFDEQRKNFSISAVIDPPHDDDLITIFFRPINQESSFDCMLLTTSKDGCIKSWVVSEQEILVKREQKKIKQWQMHSIAKHGKDTLKSAACSSDGSLLAVVFADITLWDPETLTYQTNLQCHSVRDQIKGITFGQKECSHYLLSYSAHRLIVWNLGKLQMEWQLEVRVMYISPDPSSKHVAVFIHRDKKKSRQRKVLLLDPSSHDPLAIHPLKDINEDVTSAIFTPRSNISDSINPWLNVGRLHFLTAAKELKSILTEEATENANGKEIINKDEENTRFQDIFGSMSKVHTRNNNKDNEDETSIPVGNPTSGFVRELMSTPANVLPTADVLCKGLLRTLLVKKPTVLSIKGVICKDDEVDEDIEESEETYSDEEELDIEKRDKSQKESTKQQKKVDESDTPSHQKTTVKLKDFDFDFVLDPF